MYIASLVEYICQQYV